MESSYMMEKKVEYLVEMKFNKLRNELARALMQIQEMTKEIDLLKNKVQRFENSAMPQGQQKLTVQQQPEKKEFNQRTGQFTPEDVAIDKMFYFGNKV